MPAVPDEQPLPFNRADSMPVVPDEEPFISDPVRLPRVSIIQPQDEVAQEAPVFIEEDWVMISE